MQSLRISVLVIGLMGLIAIAARADKVTSDYDHSVNFAKYKTFMWIDEPHTDEPFMKGRIMAAVNTQLKLRGLRLVSDGADLAIGANLATEERHTWETYYSGSGWGWGSTWATTQEKTYQVGTLTVDVFDARTKTLVWEGVSTDTLSRNPQHRTKNYNKSIAKMFKDFPRYSFMESRLQRAPIPAVQTASSTKGFAFLGASALLPSS